MESALETTQEKWVENKTSKWVKIKIGYEKGIRGIAEAAYKDWKEGNEKFGNGTILMKQVAEKVGYAWSYLQDLKYIPEKLYPYVETLGVDTKCLEDIGYSNFTEIAKITDIPFREALCKEVIEKKLPQLEIRSRIREFGLDKIEGAFEPRPIIPYGEGIYFLSEKFQASRHDSDFCIIKEGAPFPTLKRRSWFFHEDMREFSLREYAKVQDFPDDFAFVGTKEKIKDQIGNAVSPKMAQYIAQFVKGKTFIELFAGCGGSSLGLEMAGWECVWINERSPSACATYHANFQGAFISNKDIKKVSVEEIKKQIGNKKIDLIFGGPPCQGFSLSGNRFKDDSRNELYKEFVRVVEGIAPSFFIMENVMGIMSFKDQIISDFEAIGYKVDFKVIKGEEIGMRQKRHRCFFIGRRN